jgi:CheY-like chemotaxis protein
MASHVRIVITDNGKGIRPEFLPQLFTRFAQQDTTITRTHSGLGLGLSIVKHLVEAHGGSIHAESDGDGKGAAFTVVLPIPTLLHAKVDALPQQGGAGRGASIVGIRVLVVDDETDARDLLEIIVKQAGGVVASARSGSEALSEIGRFNPDILVADIGMPGMDGYALIQQVRKSHGAEKLPAIALTAYTREEDRRRALESGFQAHEPKPVEPDRLISEIARLAKAGKT